MTDTVELFTDGACKGNPGPGGWGALLVCKGVEKELWGGEANTTNNRMELMGAIRGLAVVLVFAVVFSDPPRILLLAFLAYAASSLPCQACGTA